MAQPARAIVQVSPRGQVTLPAEVRHALGIRAGDALVVTVEDGQVVLAPAVVLPIEIYDEERVRELDAAAKMSERELQAARKRWGL